MSNTINPVVIDSDALDELLDHFRAEGYTRRQVVAELDSMLADDDVSFTEDSVRDQMLAAMLAAGGSTSEAVSVPQAHAVLVCWRSAGATRGQVRARLQAMASLKLNLSDGARGVLNAAWVQVQP